MPALLKTGGTSHRGLTSASSRRSSRCALGPRLKRGVICVQKKVSSLGFSGAALLSLIAALMVSSFGKLSVPSQRTVQTFDEQRLR